MQQNPSTPARNMTGRTTVAGLFATADRAQEAILALRDAGFSADKIGVAMRDRDAQNRVVEETGTKAAEGAVTGAVGGGLLGGIVGFLVGLGALAIPGIGPVVAGGVLASAFGLAGGTAVAGAGIGAAAGGIVGALVGLGIPEEEARHFESGLRGGGVLVTVNAGSRVMEALAILERFGGDTGPGSMADHTRVRGDNDSTGETVAGGAAGAAAGAVAGGVIGGPPGAVVGGVIGATAGGTAGHAVGEATDDDDWYIDERGNRVRRTKPIV